MSQLATVHELPTGRVLFTDDQGLGLRATWHLDQGLVNLSLWHGARCAESFRLSVADSARLAGFLVDGLAEAASRSKHSTGPRPAATLPTERSARWRRRLAAWLAP